MEWETPFKNHWCKVVAGNSLSVETRESCEKNYVFQQLLKYLSIINTGRTDFIPIFKPIPKYRIIVLLILWHTVWKPEVQSEKKRPLLGNGLVNNRGPEAENMRAFGAWVRCETVASQRGQEPLNTEDEESTLLEPLPGDD
jgi:hypothetical protein